MKRNLLKYGLVMVLAMIASTGLLWADCYVEKDNDVIVKVDTVAQVEIQDVVLCDNAVNIPVSQTEEVGNDRERDAEQKKGASLWMLSLPTIIIIVLALIYGIYAIYSSKDTRKLIGERKFLRACAKVINNAVPQDGLSVIGAISILLLLITISTFLMLLTMRWMDSSNYQEFGLQRLGQIGDFSSGVIGTIISLIVAIYAIRTYRLERQHQREVSVAEMLNTMLELHKQNVSEIKIKNIDPNQKELISGRDAFKQMFEELKDIFECVKKAIDSIVIQEQEKYAEWSSEKRKMQLAHILSFGYFFYSVNTYLITTEGGSELFILCEKIRAEVKKNLKNELKDLQRHRMLGHYYRHLYNMVNYIDKSDFTKNFKKKEEYVKLIRSQLSDYEEILLYYNSLAPLGKPWNMPQNQTEIDRMSLTCKYRLLKNCPSYIDYFGIQPWDTYKNEMQIWWNKEGEFFFETDSKDQEEKVTEMLNGN